ncbi:acetate kinase [Amorphus suaedae]
MILTVNAGSSSLKVAVFDPSEALAEVASGTVSRIGGAAAMKTVDRLHGERASVVEAADHDEALARLIAALAPVWADQPLTAVGHRIVHGGSALTEPRVLDDATMAELARLEPLAPLHVPINLACVRAARAAAPSVVQVGCFDTGFHQTMPWVQSAFALPARFYDEGLRRYGFHGLSYTSVSRRLKAMHPELHAGRVIVAHLGNGASMCAVAGGESRATTMGFSTLDGLAMGTRCGQIDPGALLHLMRFEGMGLEELERLLYRESGLLGLSGVSADMRDVEAAGTPAAEAAIAYFVARAQREIGGLTAVLGGLDALVFCGGIGENSRRVRADIVAGLGYLGLAIDADANARNATDMSAGPTPVLVIPTSEEEVIAEAAARLAGGPTTA